VSDYQFPSWRRLIFLAGLIAILLLTLTPSVTKGNINVRVYALLPQGIVKHFYSSFTGIQVHVAGLPDSNGWSSIGKNPTGSTVDLIPQSSQLIPSVVLVTSLPSGRYDSIKMSFANSTLVLQNGVKIPIATGPSLVASATISVPPNGNGDLLFVLSFDYSLLIATNPSISTTITQVNSF